MPIVLWIIAAYIICLLVVFVVRKARNEPKTEKRKSIGAIVLWIFSVLIICLIVWGFYEFTTENEPGFYVDHEKSYILEEFCEGDAIHYTVSLCVRNRRPTIRQVIGLKLWIFGRDGNEEKYERVDAEIISPFYGDCIIFAPFWSKQIECTFSIKDFGVAFHIGCIKYADG